MSASLGASTIRLQVRRHAGAGGRAIRVGRRAELVLDRLEVQPGAKVTLSNRAGFEYHGVSVPEAVYVKNLILHPDAVLNTGLQTLYYETVKDEDGNTLDPNNLPGGRQIVDVPLLGFSLGIIAMNDTTAPPFNEFDVRVRQRLRDSPMRRNAGATGSARTTAPRRTPPRARKGRSGDWRTPVFPATV